jgi:hypothetical protein
MHRESFPKLDILTTNMDHKRENLDECVFDYLASNPDRYIHYRQIFEDITEDTGHRCSDLTDTLEDRRYFMTVCYSLNHQYKNILKFHRDRDLYLAFEKDTIESNTERYRGKPWTGLPFSTVIDELFSKDMHREFDTDYYYQTFEKEPLLHEMIRYGVSNDTVRNLIIERKLDIEVLNDHDQTLLDVAIAVQNGEMVRFLVRLTDLRDEKRMQRQRQRQRETTTPPVQARGEMSNIQTAKYTVIAFGYGFGMYASYALVSAISSMF